MVGIVDEVSLHYPLGTRIKVGKNHGTVRYVGEVGGYVGTWLGIEWDDCKRGKHNGTLNGRHYYSTFHSTGGSFIRPEKIGLCESLDNAVRHRYLDYSHQSLNQQLLQETRECLQAPLFEVVGLEKLARKQSKFEQLIDISVEDSPVNSAGCLTNFTALTTLNLSHTLIGHWEVVADICRQVPTLQNINLSRNRLQVLTDTDLKKISRNDFNNLKSINLSQCNIANWADVLQIARLWPYIQSIGLQGNPLSTFSPVNIEEIFRNLKELDLHDTKIKDFNEVCKLGNIKTLTSLNLMGNEIEEIKLPNCEPESKLDIFINLEQLNISHNPVWNEVDTFNELDKLPKLKRLSKTPHMKSNFEDMLTRAVAFISSLEVVNKVSIIDEERRGAEYEIWKKYATEWMKASSKSSASLNEFYKQHRSYARLVQKYGSPAEFVPSDINTLETPNRIKVNILNAQTGVMWQKTLPRIITVHTLLGLILKHYGLKNISQARLSYIDSNCPQLVVSMDNLSKTLDFYSLQENDIVQLNY